MMGSGNTSAINTHKKRNENTFCEYFALYYEKLVGSATKSFTDMVISNEMIENTMKSGKLDAEEKKIGTMRKKEGET